MQKGKKKGEDQVKAQLEEGTAIQHQRRSTERRPEDSLGEVSSQSVGFRELTGSKVWSLPLACFAALNARKCLLLFFFFSPCFFHGGLCASRKSLQQAPQTSLLPEPSIVISSGPLKHSFEQWQRPFVPRRLPLVLLQVLA